MSAFRESEMVINGSETTRPVVWDDMAKFVAKQASSREITDFRDAGEVSASPCITRGRHYRER
jgi:hypothetical protein